MKTAAIVVSGALGQKAGPYLAAALLCQELVRLNRQVTCFAQSLAISPDSPPAPFRIVQPLMRRGWRWDWPGKCLAWQARRCIRCQPDAAVFVMGLTRLAGFLLRSDVAGRLLVWENTNANPGNKFVDPEAGRRLGRCRAVLSPSRTIDEAIRQTYAYTGPLFRLPYWIEDQQKPYNPPRDFIADFIYLGRRDAEKGLAELVRAAAAVAKQRPELRVLIAGAGSEEPYASQARELGVAQNVRFQFFPGRDEAMSALARSRCLVLPSYHEGYPLVLLEAAQLSVPCIATRVGSVPEVFDGSMAAILLPPRDASLLAGAMLTVLAEPPSRHEERCHAAHELFSRLNSAGAVASRLQHVLKSAESGTRSAE
jgi:glycosyltransferase involved in cell wall biosynthesis